MNDDETSEVVVVMSGTDENGADTEENGCDLTEIIETDFRYLGQFFVF